jgi:excisionase family DNA binding protein
MSQSALSNIEREKRSARPATIHRIARALRVPVAAITREFDESGGPSAWRRARIISARDLGGGHQGWRKRGKETMTMTASQAVHPTNALLTPAEVAAAFRVDPKTVTRWAKAGKLRSIRTLGGHRRYLEAEVREMLSGFPGADDSHLWLARGNGVATGR